MQVVLAIDFGGTNIKGALIDEHGFVHVSRSVPTKSDSGPVAICEDIAALSRDLAKACSDEHTIVAAGVGVPGPIDAQEGIVLRCPNIGGWEDFDIVSELKKLVELPVFIENDANAAVLAEAWVGGAKGAKNVVCLTLGTGIGSGIIVNGQLLSGVGQASELGHMIIREGGRLCGCGAHGCFEAYASANSVAAIAKEAILYGGPLVKNSTLYGTEPTCAAVFKSAGLGDALAIRLVADTSRYLAAGIASVVNIFHPEAIILTGGMINAGDEAVLGTVRKYLPCLAMKELLKDVKISLSPLQNRAGILGAAAVAFSGLKRHA